MFCSIIILSSRTLERSLNYSRMSEKTIKAAYDRINLYRDLFSHDINNMLQNIQGFIDLSSIYIQDPNNIEKIHNLLKVANQQVYRGANLVSNVRNLTELEKNKYGIRDIEALIILKQATKNIKEHFMEKNINIQIEVHSEKLYLKGTEMLIFVFENLLRNSILYNKNSPIDIKIEITNELTNDVNYTTFKFVDNGTGIPDVQKEKLFLGGLASDDYVGRTGLSLLLVSKIIESYHGRIKVIDKINGEYNQGSIFIVQIPASD